MRLSDFSNTASIKKRIGIIRLTGLALAVCLAFSLLQAGSANATASTAAVNSASLSIRASAKTNAHVVTVLHKGDIVKVLSTKGAWKQIAASNGLKGWCQSRYLSDPVFSSSFKAGSNVLLDWPSDYIDLSKAFTYQRCMQDMKEIANAYSGNARIETIGTTVMGNAMNAIVIGNPNAKTRIFVQASIHARESISALLALREAECILKDASVGATYKGVNVADLLDNVEIWVLPMANPDGVRLVYEGLAAVPASMPALASSIKAMNNGQGSYIRWKANANGVDLNRNFDAGWGLGSSNKKPGSENYPGTAPFTEPETIAMRDLAVAQDFALTLSFHTSGDMIYWYNPKGDNTQNLYIANEMKSLNGYRILSPSVQAFDGGFRDWFVKTYNRPGLTIEVGSGYCPLPQSAFAGIWDHNRYVMLDAAWLVMPKSLSAYVN